ncbi:hypothetical protein HOD05_00965 [Candidatus Woesearchaeota archaeon]|jgi:hypothetical protein|nr:hypothetical protein [Candidatus Woesearchaeota archaeon]MBT4150978.1 hypothetical protein [Candidatus Woesearchaeota archaeon]MBT4247258.1 hypothetical protein [Candidatus Woesearchaeota archaeon]MBT4433768.1 hypothetical protein [Candidatus Woesearchaeota archaeon]MBT7331899.1 hypothetical protein [Candidatus Woesearchaeota archaeon]
MTEEGRYYQGFLLALREHTDTFPLDGERFHQAFVKATKDSCLESELDPVFGTSQEAKLLWIEGTRSLLLESNNTHAFYRLGHKYCSTVLREERFKDQAEIYRTAAKIFWDDLNERKPYKEVLVNNFL